MADTKYDESFPDRAMDFAAVGLTDRQIALKMDISRSSFYNYKQQHPDFAEAIEWGRELVDSRVENSLLHLAMGDYTITTNVTDQEGRTRTTVKDAVPNLKAIQYWLERSDRRKGIKAPPCGSRDCGIDKQEKREKLEDEQPKFSEPDEKKSSSVSSVSSVVNVPSAPDLDPSEIGGLQALAEYKAQCPADAGDGFSKKETEEFEEMMLVTFTEMARRKYNTQAEAEGRPVIPYTVEAPRTVKGKYAKDLIENWKARAEFFEMSI